MTENKLGLNWSAVEKALAEGTFSGYKIGILETEKLFGELLRNKKIPGQTIERKIKYLQHFLSLPDKLDYSRHIYERIVSEPHFEISREETKHAISGYWQAMLDIEEAVETLGLKTKFALRLRYILGIALGHIHSIGITVLLAAGVIYFLAETAPGHKAVKFIVSLNHFFIFKILFWSAIILLALAALGAILYFVTSRKKRF